MIPGVEIITPIRDMQLSRQEEIDYLKSKGVKMNFEKSVYSINKGLWGTSVGGVAKISDLGFSDVETAQTNGKHTRKVTALRTA